MELQLSCSSNQFLQSFTKEDYVFESGNKYFIPITLVVKFFIWVYKMLPDRHVITLSANPGGRYSSGHRSGIRVGAIHPAVSLP